MAEEIIIPLAEGLYAEDLEKPEQPPDHFDPVNKLTDDELEMCFKNAKEIVEKDYDRTVELTKTSLQVQGQNYGLFSFIGENCNQKSKELGMKLYGVFNTLDEARNHAQLLQRGEENRDFDICICEMYSWCLIPPNISKIPDQEYREGKLNELIKGHKIEQQKAAQVFDIRKHKLRQNEDLNAWKKPTDVNAIEDAEGAEPDAGDTDVSEWEKHLLETTEIIEQPPIEYGTALQSQLRSGDDASYLDFDMAQKKRKKYQNEDAMLKVFGKPHPLPKFELIAEPQPIDPIVNDNTKQNQTPPTTSLDSTSLDSLEEIKNEEIITSEHTTG